MIYYPYMIYAIICSRKKDNRNNLKNILEYFTKAEVKYHVSYDAESIFKGYREGLEALKPEDNDIIILCHDDIEIISDRDSFKSVLENSLAPKKVAFVGVAGTTHLAKDAVWWDLNRRQQGLHRGFVFQGENNETMTPNYFGPAGTVVALDGCFIATKKYILDDIGIDQPDSFEGKWDFYDLLFTVTAYNKGYFNKAVPVVIRHNSRGELVGRDSWFKNRGAFMRMFNLPIICK